MQGAILIKKFASMYLIYIVLYYNLQNMTKSSTVCKLFFYKSLYIQTNDGYSWYASEQQVESFLISNAHF